MDKKTKELVEKRMKDGWIKVAMMVEAMAISKDAVESALKKHLDKMGKEKDVILYHSEFKSTEEVEKPLPNVPKGFSQVVDVELAVENFEKLVYMVYTYGPSSTEILQPEKLRMDMGEAQNILNTIATMVHRFAALGGGGLLVTA